MTRGSEYQFEVWQGGLMVVQGYAPDEETAIKEAAHYGMVYRQDGPVEVIVRPTADSLWPAGLC